MKRPVSTLIAGTAIALLSLTPGLAADSSEAGSQTLNGQIQLNNVTSTLKVTANNVGGDVTTQSAAVGNLLDVTTMNDTQVVNNQLVSAGEIGSYSGVAATNVTGSVTVVNQAICNAASVSTDPTLTAVTSNQECYTKDPAAIAYVDAVNVGGNVTIANSALGNSLEADSNATNMPITTNQINNSVVTAATTANIKNVAGAVSVTSTAVGNSAQIIHYSTD